MRIRPMRVFDKYHTKYINSQKASQNDMVSKLMQQYYQQLHRLVKSEDDEDTFNDAFIKLTYCFNPDEDFINQFTYQFNLLKGKYHRYDKTLKWCQIPENIINDTEEPEKMNQKQLLKRILDYAILEKAKANKTEVD